ncbi:ribosomal RNA-processing protein 17 [Prosopis cineraria]|uniref:ribosomal RNA-processing protein 17 n=1 Tax=Prosopis cineraria TaxID=364024 RepID=UPI0024100151|nr:ribosomal RNA-processing protein 17 [Prosopis cineraria]
MVGNVEEEVVPQVGSQGRHLKKRALKNKALAVGFNEKDLKDYVTGFHKRKKKRRKEAQRKQEEAERWKRIELRKKRRLEKELALYGGVLPTTDPEPDDEVDGNEEDKEQVESLSGRRTYENDDVKVTVITSEIGHEEETYPRERIVSHPVVADKKHNVPIKHKKPFKKVAKRKSRPNPKRGKNKGKKQNKKR